jgi:TPR repeat protein
MAVKFPLKMPDGTGVRTIDELREHFDLKAVLAYYSSGKLAEWLESRYYDDEAKQVKAVEPSSDSLAEKLCNILGVEYLADKDEGVDVGDIVKNNEHRKRLKKYTADDEILNAVEIVAFNQKELDDLLQKGNETIYLFRDDDTDCFTIPGGIGVTYIGIHNPVVELNDEILAENIRVQGVEIQVSDISKTEKIFSKTSLTNNPELAVRVLHKIAEQGNPIFQRALGQYYSLGIGVEKDEAEAVKWYQKAAEQGDEEAQLYMSGCYRDGTVVEQDEDESLKWLKKAADQGNAKAQCKLGHRYATGDHVNVNKALAVRLYHNAAEQGDAEAQYKFGQAYAEGMGTLMPDKNMARIWYQKAAEQGNIEAQYELGQMYAEECDDDMAAIWYRKAAEQGYQEAKERLIEIDPKIFRFTDVAEYAIGGKEYLDSVLVLYNSVEIKVNKRFVLSVNRHIFEKFGAEKVWEESNVTQDIASFFGFDSSRREADRTSGCFHIEGLQLSDDDIEGLEKAFPGKIHDYRQ